MSDLKELLDKFSTGEITAEEENRLFRLLDEQRDELAFDLHHEYLHLLGTQQNIIKKERSAQILKKLHVRIREIEGTDQETQIIPLGATDRSLTRVSVGFLKYFVAAASIALLLAGGWLYVTSNVKTRQDLVTNSGSGNPEISRTNKGTATMPVALPDGSSVWLHPNSTVSYKSKFDGAKREVHLKGTAFFEVSKNPGQPFIVITNDMLTTVLGTSFTVSAVENESRFSVSVKTGNVIVTTPATPQMKDKQTKATGVSLAANEVAIFDRVQKVFQSGNLASEITMIKPVKAPENYHFQDIAVADIFKKLSKDYGVPIELDEKVLSGCSLNTTLSDKPFFEKLKIICEGIGPGTNYSEQNGVITINSLGCNK